MIIERMKPTARQLQNRNVYVVKLQTTGTEPDDEILELCVLDARDPWQGGDRRQEPKPLFHSRFRPEYRTEWPQAARVNGITPAMVARAPLLDELRDTLVPLFMRCDCLVCYNAGFDFSFLRRQFVFRAALMTVDLMRDWTELSSGGTSADSVPLPFLPQKDLFRHFNWKMPGTLGECLGIRHCFLQLIPQSAIHIRRPLLERRRSRAAEMQLAEVQADFAAEAASANPGPYLVMTEEGEDIQVTLGVRDPARLLYVGDPPSVTLTVPGSGSAAEVRTRIAGAISGCAALPSGLRELARDILLDTRVRRSEKVEPDKSARPQLDDAGRAGRQTDAEASAPAAEALRNDTVAAADSAAEALEGDDGAAGSGGASAVADGAGEAGGRPDSAEPAAAGEASAAEENTGGTDTGDGKQAAQRTHRA